ncbi:MAG: RNA polymerase sigma factor FliA [Halioglobus sp.]|nr:RNA polymerase sigma factor FliA [Halioglobus sp.]
MNDASAYDREQRRSMDDLVRDYLPLVKKIALHWSARLPPVIELDDLMQVGLMGLIQASENYDSSQGASFATYASIRVKGAILDEVRRNDWVPRSVQQKMAQVSAAIQRVEARLGAAANAADIAGELGVSLQAYQTVAAELTCARMTSLEDAVLDTADTGADTGADPAASLEDAGFRRALAEAIQFLPDKEQLMMSLYYTDELNLKEIGAVLGVSESRVSQIHGQALARLRARLAHWTA